MGSNESDVNELNSKLYENDESEIVSLNVENVTLVTDTVNTIEGLLDVSKASPFALFDNHSPFL